MSRRKTTIVMGMVAALALYAYPARAVNVDKQVQAPVHKAINLEKQTQKQAVQWQRERDKKIVEFQNLERQFTELKAVKEQMISLNKSLKATISKKQRQLADIAQIEAQITPFLAGLLENIKRLNARDLPFLTQERQKRIDALASRLADPGAQVSETFRKLMEALLVEAEYGRTVEVYQQTVPLAGEDTLVNIFRLGRLRLFYQTLDKQACGYFNPAEKAWIPLPKAYLKTVQAAVDMGSKRKPVALLDLPLGRMVTQ